MLIVVRIPEAIIDHRVDHVLVAHTEPRSGTCQEIGSIAHALHPARDDYFTVARENGLSAEHDCLHAASTDFVDRQGRHRLRQTRIDRSLPCGRLTHAGRENVAHEDFRHLLDVGT